MPDGGVFGMYTDWWNDGARGNPAWATYHLRVLRREIERRYPIRAGRRWHAIGGISMGGQGTLRYAAMLPGYFGSAAGFSAALPDTQIPDHAGRPARAPGDRRTRHLRPGGGRLRRGQQSAGAGAELRPHASLPDVGQRRPTAPRTR